MMRAARFLMPSSSPRSTASPRRCAARASSRERWWATASNARPTRSRHSSGSSRLVHRTFPSIRATRSTAFASRSPMPTWRSCSPMRGASPCSRVSTSRSVSSRTMRSWVLTGPARRGGASKTAPTSCTRRGPRAVRRGSPSGTRRSVHTLPGCVTGWISAKTTATCIQPRSRSRRPCASGCSL